MSRENLPGSEVVLPDDLEGAAIDIIFAATQKYFAYRGSSAVLQSPNGQMEDAFRIMAKQLQVGNVFEVNMPDGEMPSGAGELAFRRLAQFGILQATAKVDEYRRGPEMPEENPELSHQEYLAVDIACNAIAAANPIRYQDAA